MNTGNVRVSLSTRNVMDIENPKHQNVELRMQLGRRWAADLDGNNEWTEAS